MIFQYIPFADHNAMLDPPSVDITGRMLEMLAVYGYTRSDKRVHQAIKFIFDSQESDGKLVWPLGRELFVWHVSSAARPGCHRRRSPRAADSAGPRSGFAWSRTPTAAGAKPAAATTIRTRAALAQARPRRPHGQCSACSPPATIDLILLQGRALAARPAT